MLSVSPVRPVTKTSRNLPICTSSVRQHRPVHGFTVDVSAVEAADVDNLEFAAYAPELGVPAADGDVIEEDIAIRVTTGRRGGLVEQEPRPGVRAALHHRQRRAPRQRLRTQQPALGASGGRRVVLVVEVGTKRGGPLPGDVFRPLVLVVTETDTLTIPISGPSRHVDRAAYM
jgi:hypothetical protein